MKLAGLAAVLVMLAAGCGGSAKLAGTRLTLTALNPNVGMAVFHLECQPARGDVADPAAACAALAHSPTLVTSPAPFTCFGGPTSWFDVTISGRLAGAPVHEKFATCWTRQSATLGKLGIGGSLSGHIRTRRVGIVNASRTFASGALRPGDVLVCGLPGHRGVELGIPARHGSLGSAGSGGPLGGATLTGTRHSDGSIVASCTTGTA